MMANAKSISERYLGSPKQRGGSRVHRYRIDDAELRHHRDQVQWAPRIAEAIATNRFVLYGQEAVALDSIGKPDRYIEILVRMTDERGELILPSEFIPAAKAHGLITHIDHLVVRKTIRALASHIESSPDSDIATLAINISDVSIGNPDFPDLVIGLIEAYDVPAAMLCFELTETAVISDIGSALHFMNTLRQKGCRFSMDDFGTGVSSLAHLKQFPIDYLKIDGRFIRNIATNHVDRATVAAIQTLGEAIGIPVIAECVESQMTLNTLANLGVGMMQGCAFGEPSPLDNFLNYVEKQA